LLIDTDILKTVTSPNPKPKVKLRRRNRHLKNRCNIISAEDGPIYTKFGSLMQ